MLKSWNAKFCLALTLICGLTRQSMIGTTGRLMRSMSLTGPFPLEQSQNLKYVKILPCIFGSLLVYDLLLKYLLYSHLTRCWFLQVIAQIWVLLLGGLGVAYGLDKWVCSASCFGFVLFCGFLIPRVAYN